jgi:signal transduction histidine kinase/DNA-binding response OmpR family regulator
MLKSYVGIFLCSVLFILPHSPLLSKDKYLIGFSQCTSDGLWRQSMQRLMQIELSLHLDMQLVIKDAGGDSKKQIEQINEFLKDGIDLLIVSPNESAPTTPVIANVFNFGIPVIVIDRKIETESYSAFIGGNNYQIGLEAGKYAAKLLKGKGKIIEIRGLDESSPAIERRKGFMEILSQNPGIDIVYSESGEWTLEGSRRVMENVFQKKIDFDLVFAGNDDMAREAYLVTKEYNLNKKPYFLGIDGLPGNQGGVQAVIDHQIDATFLYPTGGEEAIDVASKILHKEPFNREYILETILIDSTNAKTLKLQTDQLELWQKKIEAQKSVLDIQISRYQSQKLLLIFAIALLILIAILVLFIYLAFRNKKIANENLELKNTKINKQNEAIKEQRDKLVEVSRQLEEATQAKIRFFTNISHEFRTPLTLITGPLENMMEDEGLSPRLKRQFELMHRNSLRLLRLVNQLMDFRKLEDDKMELFASEQDLIAFLLDIKESFASLTEKKKIDFQLITNLKVLNMWFDKDKLDKVIFNLLSNAFKFTHKGGKITITVLDPKPSNNELYKEEIEIEIRDNGEGISSKYVNLIFDRFFQAEKSHHFKGTGLGLSLSKDLIELSHGKIRVESILGEGTAFFITLPMGKEHLKNKEIYRQVVIKTPLKEKPIVLNKIPVEVDINSKKKMKQPVILIVEDESDVREYVIDCLGNKYSTIESTDGEQGLQIALESDPDLIICDIMMPKMNGLELTKILKSDYKTCHIPIILLTAKTSLEHKLEGLEEGADSYISKPFNKQHLIIRVRKLLEQRNKIREHYKDNLDFEMDEQLNSMDKKFLTKLTSYIDNKEEDNDFTVTELSKKLGMSRVHLYRKIKKLTDMSVSEFIVSVKLKRSLTLLRNSGKTIAEIAYEVGFSNPSYYARCFKNQFKILPSEYKSNIHFSE